MKPNDTDKNMNPTKEGRNHWRKRLSPQYTCFNAAHADFTIRLLDALEEADRGRLEWTDDPPKVPGGVLVPGRK